MDRWKERMSTDLELRCYRPGTIDSYLRQAELFADYFGKLPSELGETEIREYLMALKTRVGPSAVKLSVAALKFLYVHTLNRPEEVARIPWPQTPKPLPDILSGSEVSRLLESIKSLKYRMIAMVTSGKGLCISEACSLKVGDIDAKRMLIHVRDGKRRRDRYLMLPERLLLCLREYWKEVRPPGEWLFPDKEKTKNKHINENTVREAFKQAARDARITKRITPHILRHAFANHLLELGSDIRTIQVLLGHGSIRTTERYVKVSKSHVGRVTSPLDLLGTKKGKLLG